MSRYRFPRSSVEAFADAERAGYLYGPHRRPLAERVADVLLATIIGTLLALSVVHWWST